MTYYVYGVRKCRFPPEKLVALLDGSVAAGGRLKRGLEKEMQEAEHDEKSAQEDYEKCAPLSAPPGQKARFSLCYGTQAARSDTRR